jgi:hypothetical protein
MVTSEWRDGTTMLIGERISASVSAHFDLGRDFAEGPPNDLSFSFDLIIRQRLVLGDSQSSVLMSEVTSAAPIVVFTIVQGSGRLRILIPPNLLLTICRTIPVACAQSSSLGSIVVIIVMSAYPELGIAKPTGKLRPDSRNAMFVSVAISSNASLTIARCASGSSSVDLGSTIWGIVLFSLI